MHVRMCQKLSTRFCITMQPSVAQVGFINKTINSFGRNKVQNRNWQIHKKERDGLKCGKSDKGEKEKERRKKGFPTFCKQAKLRYNMNHGLA